MSDTLATHIFQISNGAVLTLDDLGIGTTSGTKLTLSKAFAPGTFDHTSSPPTGGFITSSVDGLPYWVTSGGTVYGSAVGPDLTALEALSGTNTIYYRSAADTWSAVTIGAGLTFTAGTLASTGSTVAWGAITGTLSNQTDLQTALDGKQPLDSELTALAGLTSAANKAPYFTGAGTAALADFTTFARTLVDDADAVTMRATLGVTIGTQVQAYNAALASIAGLSTVANSMIYFTSPNVAAVATVTDAARTLLDDADVTSMRSTLGLVIGTNVQAYDADLTSLAGVTGTNTIYYRSAAETWSAVTIGAGLTFTAGTLDAAGGAATWGAIVGTLSDQIDLQAALDAKQTSHANLTAIAGLTSAVDTLPYFTGSGTAALATFTAAARSLLDDSDATAMRSTLGLVIGTNVQAYDADLTALAALSGTNTIYYRSAADTWSAVTIGAGLSFAAGTLTATGAGSGDVVGPGSSVASVIALFDGVTGKLIKEATGTGIAVVTAGVFSTVTLPSGDVVGTTQAQTLTNKTLTAPIIATISNTGTITLPTSTDTLVGRATTDTLTNKTLTAPVIATIVNTGTLTLPTSTDTLVGRDTTDTLTNKTLTAPIIATIVNTGTITLPTATTTLVGRDTTDTLTNKTLTAPIIATISNTGTITLPTATTTLVGRGTTDTLTNKRVQPRISSTASSATPTADVSVCDIYKLTALAVNATFGIPTGSPLDGEKLLYKVKDNGSARTLAWNAIFRSGVATLPSTTVASKTTYILVIYNADDSKWDCLAVGTTD